ncbi:MAG: RES family NAD+ phosphorylase [Candidatus Marinimicrobia bacterium]|nr:RES family NAD+ phosphorylase [Candidatus Neomarinimicrobiota bacterium]
MFVYRLAKKGHPGLSGKGAEKFGGRWNSKGTPMIYASESRALSMLEKYVHLPPGILPKGMLMLTIAIPDTVVPANIGVNELVSNWKTDNAGLIETKKIGNDFIASNSACVLRVPSAIVPGDHNFLINPDHPDFNKIMILEEVDFPFDDRLFIK